MTTATFGTYISADSHVTEPPEVWTDRLDAEFRDRAPILTHPPGMGATVPPMALLMSCEPRQ